ncbi:MAG TPA: hypothetical protein VG963_17755 [Polyangiaceae bacterium]|nr:hypothetical protein [Polyangiaceae bacterium]
MQRAPDTDPSAAKADAPRPGRAAEASRRRASRLVTVLFAFTLAAVCPLVCKLPYSMDTLYALEGLLATGILVCGACALALLCG